MYDSQFDELMKERAQKEHFTAVPSAEKKLQQAMRTGAAQLARKGEKRQWPQLMAASLAVAAAALVLMLVQAPGDRWKNAQTSTVIAASEAVVPVTVPQAWLEATLSKQELAAEATFANHTGDIWMITWDASVPSNAESEKVQTELIWLETGITFRDSASWEFSTIPETALDVKWHYDAYRVTASVLHWVEGDWLYQGEDGYEEQQALIEDAFAAGALILSPGDWPEGTSGEMSLVLPDSYQAAYPTITPLHYYTAAGMLELAVAREETVAAVIPTEK